MMTQKVTKPAILLDMKWNRIRINKETLYLLGKPKYIEILVSPKNRGFIVRSAPDGKNSHAITTSHLTNKNGFELSSCAFIREIQNITDTVESPMSYRIHGTMNPEGNAAVFLIDDAVPLHRRKDDILYA